MQKINILDDFYTQEDFKEFKKSKASKNRNNS